MGCDMHCIIERKNKTGEWEVIKGYDRHLLFMRGRKNDRDLGYYEENKKLIADWIYDGRNYELFATLANVRNDGNIRPMFPDRGVPEDASKETAEEVGDIGFDGHSHTYFTLHEFSDVLFDGYDMYMSVTPLKNFINTVIVKIKKLANNAYDGDDGVRLIIFFDS